MPNSTFQNRLDAFTRITHQNAYAAITQQGPCTHDRTEGEKAETALCELFRPDVRDQAEQLTGEIFYHVNEVAQLHEKALKRIRLTREQTIAAQIAEHEAATKAVVAKLEALLS